MANKETETMIKIGTVAVVAILLYLVITKIDLVLERIDQYLLIKAVNECGQVASVTYQTDRGLAETTKPFEQAYQQCLRDKGIK